MEKNREKGNQEFLGRKRALRLGVEAHAEVETSAEEWDDPPRCSQGAKFGTSRVCQGVATVQSEKILDFCSENLLFVNQ